MARKRKGKKQGNKGTGEQNTNTTVGENDEAISNDANGVEDRPQDDVVVEEGDDPARAPNNEADEDSQGEDDDGENEEEETREEVQEEEGASNDNAGNQVDVPEEGGGEEEKETESVDATNGQGGSGEDATAGDDDGYGPLDEVPGEAIPALPVDSKYEVVRSTDNGVSQEKQEEEPEEQQVTPRATSIESNAKGKEPVANGTISVEDGDTYVVQTTHAHISSPDDTEEDGEAEDDAVVLDHPTVVRATELREDIVGQLAVLEQGKTDEPGSELKYHIELRHALSLVRQWDNLTGSIDDINLVRAIQTDQTEVSTLKSAIKDKLVAEQSVFLKDEGEHPKGVGFFDSYGLPFPLRDIQVSGVLFDAIGEISLAYTFRNPIESAEAADRGLAHGLVTVPVPGNCFVCGVNVTFAEQDGDNSSVHTRVAPLDESNRSFSAPDWSVCENSSNVPRPPYFRAEVGNIPHGSVFTITVSIMADIGCSATRRALFLPSPVFMPSALFDYDHTPTFTGGIELHLPGLITAAKVAPVRRYSLTEVEEEGQYLCRAKVIIDDTPLPLAMGGFEVDIDLDANLGTHAWLEEPLVQENESRDNLHVETPAVMMLYDSGVSPSDRLFSEFVVLIEPATLQAQGRWRHMHLALAFFLKSLPHGSLFNIVGLVGDEAHVLFEAGSRIYNQSNLDRAQAFIDSFGGDPALEKNGRSQRRNGEEFRAADAPRHKLVPALQAVFAMPPLRAFPRQLAVFVSSVPSDAADALRSIGQHCAHGHTRFFNAAPPSDMSLNDFVEHAQLASGSPVSPAPPRIGLVLTLVQFLTMTVHPTAANIAIMWPNDARITQIPSSHLHQYGRDALTVCAFYEGPSIDSVPIRAVLGSGPELSDVEMWSVPQGLADHQLIHKYTARRLLLDLEGRGGDLLRDEVAYLAEFYELESRFSVFKSVDHDQQHANDEPYLIQVHAVNSAKAALRRSHFLAQQQRQHEKLVYDGKPFTKAKNPESLNEPQVLPLLPSSNQAAEARNQSPSGNPFTRWMKKVQAQIPTIQAGKYDGLANQPQLPPTQTLVRSQRADGSWLLDPILAQAFSASYDHLLAIKPPFLDRSGPDGITAWGTALGLAFLTLKTSAASGDKWAIFDLIIAKGHHWVQQFMKRSKNPPHLKNHLLEQALKNFYVPSIGSPQPSSSNLVEATDASRAVQPATLSMGSDSPARVKPDTV